MDQVLLPPVAKPDTVFVTDTLFQRVVADAQSTGDLDLRERVFTSELVPDTVYVSAPSVADSTREPLPRFSVQYADKEGTKLTIETLDRELRSAQRHIYTLPSKDADFSIRSGDVPGRVRTDRSLRTFQFGGRVDVYAGANLVSGEPTLRSILTGPLKVRSKNFSISPYLAAGGSEGIEGGARLSYSINGF